MKDIEIPKFMNKPNRTITQSEEDYNMDRIFIAAAAFKQGYKAACSAMLVVFIVLSLMITWIIYATHKVYTSPEIDSLQATPTSIMVAK